MALPVDISDPGTSGAETQAFGIGLPAQVYQNQVALQATSAISSNNQRGDSFKPGLGVATNNDNPDLVDAEDIPPLGGLATNVAAGSVKPGLGIGINVDDPGVAEVEDQPVIGLGLRTNSSGDSSPITSFATLNTQQNNVTGQTFGTGLPRNVNV